MLSDLLRLMNKRRRYYQKEFKYDEDLYPVINIMSLFFFVFIALSSLPFLGRTLWECSLNFTTYIIHVFGILFIYTFLTRSAIWLKAIKDFDWYASLVEMDKEISTLIMRLSVEDFLEESNGKELLDEMLMRQQEMIYFVRYYSIWLFGSHHERLYKDLTNWNSLYSKYPA